MNDDVEALLPLSEPALEILLSLGDRKLHGYALLQDIEQRTSGRVRLTASTLYGALQRLRDQGVVAEARLKGGDSRRRTYALTALGRRVVRAEGARLHRQLETAYAKRLVPRRSS